MSIFGPFLLIFFASSCGMKKPFQTTHPWKNTVRVKILVKNFLRRVKKISVKFTKGTVEEPQKTFTPPQKSFLRFLQRTFSEFYEKKTFYSSKSFLAVFLPLRYFFRGVLCEKVPSYHTYSFSDAIIGVKTDSCVAGCSNYHQKIPPWKIQQG